MEKITNARLEELENYISKPPSEFKKEDGKTKITIRIVQANNYEIACLIIRKLVKIDLVFKTQYQTNQLQDKFKRYLINRKINFIKDLSNRLYDEQAIELGIYIPCRLIPGEYEVNEDYVEIFGKCIKLKENTELNIKLQNKLPNKEEKINKGKL
jgi:hypothetical protein